MSFVPSPQYLTVQQVADMCKVQPVTIYRWLKLPDPIPSHQVSKRGRRLFDPTEVQAWVQCRCTSPTPGQTASEQAS